jgi:SNARE protein
VEQLSGEVRWARSEQERSGLFGDPKARAAAGGPPSGNQEMLDKAVNIQMKTEQSLMSTQKMVQASKEVANATSAQLQQQRNQIVQITEEVMRIEDGLQRADKLIRNFARRMATDRVILLFTFLVFAGIAGIVVYKSMHPNDQTFYVPDEVVPPNPVEIYNKTRDAINSTLNSNS